VHERAVVAISASSAQHCDPQNAADLADDSVFVSEEKLNQWLCYDFKERIVRPTISVMLLDSRRFLRHWVIEGSRGGNVWVELDRCDDDAPDHVGEWMGIGVFEISQPQNVRMIRLRQTHLNHCGDHILAIKGFEILGSLSSRTKSLTT
jgi:hypothetical protein